MRILPLVVVCNFVSAGASSTANAEGAISAGLSGWDELLPFASYTWDESWTSSPWNVSLVNTGRFQFDSGLGDASLQSKAHSDTTLNPNLILSLDAAYLFDRELTEAIKQSHTASGDVGLEYAANNFKLAADIGTEVQLFEDTTQAGFAPLDRKREDNFDSEAALRWTISTHQQVQPFLETAWVRRNYLINTGRDFSGPDLVIGVSLLNQTLTGDLGLIIVSRDSPALEQVTTIGPYIDITWNLSAEAHAKLAASAGIGQDTSGSPDMYPFHSFAFELSNSLSDAVKLVTSFEAVSEDRTSGRETELIPKAKLTWTTENGVSLYGSIGATHTIYANQSDTTEPNVEAGLMLLWK